MNMKDHIRVVIEYTVNEGKLDEFKKLAQAVVEKSEKNESRMLAYEWYVSVDGTKCALLQTLAGSDAVMAHLGNVGELLGPLHETVVITGFKVYGNPSSEVREAYGQFGPQYFERFRGFAR
jgi:quinol monooxygenase YgiN